MFAARHCPSRKFRLTCFFLGSTSPLHLMSSYQSRVLVRHLPSRTQEGVPRGYFPIFFFVFGRDTDEKEILYEWTECAKTAVIHQRVFWSIVTHSALFKVSSCHVNARCRDWEGVLHEGAAVECHVTRTFWRARIHGAERSNKNDEHPKDRKQERRQKTKTP